MINSQCHDMVDNTVVLLVVIGMQTTVALLTCVMIVVELDCDRIRDSEYNKCVYRVVLTILTVKHNT